METSIVVSCLLIFVARVADVSLGTLRMTAVMRGHRAAAWFLGFFEVLIWVFAVSKVIQNLDQPVLAVSYALGFATGTFVGVTIERGLAFGEQVVRVFSRKGAQVAAAVREGGFPVTEFEGRGRDGEVRLLYAKVPRRRSHAIVALARAADSECFYVIEDVRTTSSPPPGAWGSMQGWLGAQRK